MIRWNTNDGSRDCSTNWVSWSLSQVFLKNSLLGCSPTDFKRHLKTSGSTVTEIEKRLYSTIKNKNRHREEKKSLLTYKSYSVSRTSTSTLEGEYIFFVWVFKLENNFYYFSYEDFSIDTKNSFLFTFFFWNNNDESFRSKGRI